MQDSLPERATVTFMQSNEAATNTMALANEGSTALSEATQAR